jgi:hypothetical protein
MIKVLITNFTIFSHFCDLYLDFGFLEKDSPNFLLRKDLQYRNTYIYYFAMFMNLFLRSTWMLTISPEVLNFVVSRFKRYEIFLFFVSFLEMIRRCIWNFFKMEIEHIKNANSFKAVETMNLPIKNFKYNVDEMLIAFNDFEEINNDDSAILSFIFIKTLKNLETSIN